MRGNLNIPIPSLKDLTRFVKQSKPDPQQQQRQQQSPSLLQQDMRISNNIQPNLENNNNLKKDKSNNTAIHSSVVNDEELNIHRHVVTVQPSSTARQQQHHQHRRQYSYRADYFEGSEPLVVVSPNHLDIQVRGDQVILSVDLFFAAWICPCCCCIHSLGNSDKYIEHQL